MAIREVRVVGDPILEKACRPVEKMTPRLETLIDDMLDTMYQENGVGLAAPQVGVLRQILVVDVEEEEEREKGIRNPYIVINPKVIETSGEQEGYEGCLSLPGKVGTVKRPNRVVIEALDRNLQPYTIEGEELLARALLHEVDHLTGKMYTERCEGPLEDAEEVAAREEEEARRKKRKRRRILR